MIRKKEEAQRLQQELAAAQRSGTNQVGVQKRGMQQDGGSGSFLVVTDAQLLGC